MFKRLGRFGVLAVCLFAIVIVMVGCNREDPPPPLPEETPAEKLTGIYELVESRYPDGIILRPPSITGKMFLYNSDTLRNALYLTSADGDTFNMEFTWSMDETYFLDNVGDRLSYTWDGTHLNLTFSAGGRSVVTSWRKE